MTADCNAYDTLCNLQSDVSAYVAGAAQDDQIDRTLVVLGIFNGRAYTYSEVDGKAVIMIVNVTPDLKPRLGKIGKFELPDDAPPDFLESDGTMTGDSDHGR